MQSEYFTANVEKSMWPQTSKNVLWQIAAFTALLVIAGIVFGYH